MLRDSRLGRGHVRSARGLEQSERLSAPTAADVQPKSPLDHLEELPFFRPLVRHKVPEQVAVNLLKKRALPLLKSVVAAQIKLRGERADKVKKETKALIKEIEALDASTFSDVDTAFVATRKLSVRLESILADADYVVFGQLGVLKQLRALNVALRTSRTLWHSLRLADSMRDDKIRADSLAIIAEADAIIRRADDGEDVTGDIDALEGKFEKLNERLLHHMKTDPRLEGGFEALHTGRRIAEYRNLLEASILAKEEDPSKKKLTGKELTSWVREHGVPEEVVQEVLKEQLVKQLLGTADELRSSRSKSAAVVADRAEALAKSIEAMDTAVLTDVEELEKTTKAISAEIDSILEEAEKIVTPIDGPIAKLRRANATLGAFRGLFTAMRLSEAIEDPLFREATESLVQHAQELADEDKGELAPKLKAFEEELLAYLADLEARLKVDGIKPLEKGVAIVRGAQRVLRLQDAGRSALNPEVRAAFAALRDLDMAPSLRGEIYQAAQGEPLLDSVVGLMVAAREMELGVSFRDIGKHIEEALRIGGHGELNPLLAKSPLAFLGDADFKSAFGRLDSFFEKVDSPEGRENIDLSLNVLRAAMNAEQENVNRVALDIPEGDRLRVAAAVTEYGTVSSMILLDWMAQQLAEPSGEAMAEFLDSIIHASESHLDDLLEKAPETVSDKDLSRVKTQLRSNVESSASVTGLPYISKAAAELSGQTLSAEHAKKLDAATSKLVEALAVVETTPDSKDAIRNILRDMHTSLRILVNLIHLFGAASNDKMDPDERSKSIRGSVERMGPLFVKLMQTLVNMQGLLDEHIDDMDLTDNNPVVTSLRKLQDEVTPLPYEVIKAEVESSLGKPIGEAFEWFDPEPLKSGSIGQAHRAKIRPNPDAEPVDVVVKVLRPGIQQAFEDTVRVTRLSLAVMKELLRLDVDGAIFGEVKEEAERQLPMIERAIGGFIESFRIETNFPQERENMKAFAKMLGPDRHIAVPLVYDSHSQGNVLTMQELRGFKLTHWINRYQFAQSQEPVAEERGRLETETLFKEAEQRARDFIRETHAEKVLSSRVVSSFGRFVKCEVSFASAESGELVTSEVNVHKRTGRIETRKTPEVTASHAETKAAKWARRTFGLEVTNSQVAHSAEGGKGYLILLDFDDADQKSALAFVDAKTGEVTPRSTAPDLSHQGLVALRDRLGSSFVVQLLKGLLHGDPHEGNFFILPDGKTVGLMDFGLALKLKLLDVSGPLKLMSAALLNQPKRMAESLLRMSTAHETLMGEARRQKLAELTQACRELTEKLEKSAKTDKPGPRGTWLRRIKDHVEARFGRAVEVLRRSAEVMMQKGALAPAPRFLQCLKAFFSMAGNLAKVGKHIRHERSRVSRAYDMFAAYCAQQALAPFVTERSLARKARRIDRMSILDVRSGGYMEKQLAKAANR